jgi:hypothetical protein
MATIPGAGSTVVTFSIAGSLSAVSNYLTDFANLAYGVTKVQTLPSEVSVAGGLNEFISASGTVDTSLTTGNQLTYIASLNSSTITLAASNETVAAAGAVTVVEDGTVGGERVIFISGNNLFEGSSTGVGGDTLSGGTGYDTIDTGGGPTTVFGGTNTTIKLSDNVAGSGDLVVIENGSSTVTADGLSDTVFASASGSIIGGTGSLLLTTDGGTVSVTGGTGSFTGFLTAGTDLTFSNATSDPLGDIVAGGGNETLDGAGAAGGFTFFADTVTGSDVNDSVTGGSGYDFFSTGVGTEDYTAGTGGAEFYINDVGGTITINDFGAGDSVNFAGEDLSSSATTTVDGSTTVTLTNGTTVDFVGVTSLSGHIY